MSRAHLCERLGRLELLLQTVASVPDVPDACAWAEHVQGFPLDLWQASLLTAEPTDTLLNCARQTGKSTAVSLLAAYRAAYLGDRIICTAPSFRQSSMLFEKVKLAIARSPGVHVTESTRTRIRTASGGEILVTPGDRPSTVRGWTGHLVLMDEAGYVKDGLWAAVTPALSVSGGKLLALSTPGGATGAFYEAWMNGGDHWRRVTVKAEECPRHDPEFLERERARLGDAIYSQEYQGEFLSTPGGFFSAADISTLFNSSESDKPTAAPVDMFFDSGDDDNELVTLDL